MPRNTSWYRPRSSSVVWSYNTFPGENVNLAYFAEGGYDRHYITTNTDGDKIHPTAYAYTQSNVGYLIGTVSHTREGHWVDPSTGTPINFPYYNTSTGPFGQVYDLPMSNINALEDNAYNAAFNKMADHFRGNTDVSVDLAQGKQTLGTAKGLLSASKLAKRADNLIGLTDSLVRKARHHYLLNKVALKPDVRRSSKEIADSWLEWSYGVKPTLQTMYDVANSMLEDSSSQDDILSWTTFGSASATDAVFFPSSTDVNDKSTCKRTVSVRCRMTCSTGKLTSAQTVSKFTSLNPYSLIWEMLPYSFVVDWVLDVGGYIRGLETAALFSTNFMGGYVTISRRQLFQHNVFIETTYPGQPTWRTLTTGAGQATHTNVWRTPLSAFPMPRPPSLNLELGGLRLLNAAALLRNLIK